jgi:hypothetical protein
VPAKTGVAAKKRKANGQEYMNLLVKRANANMSVSNRLLFGVPTTGLVRIEWVQARYGQVVPCNWSHNELVMAAQQLTPLGYDVANSRNLIIQKAVLENFEWLFFIDHDVLLPPDCFLKLNNYIRSGEYPVVSGLYYTRSHPAEPLCYRGRGNSYYDKFKIGDKIMVDGHGMGCTLINVKLLKAMYADAPEYVINGKDKARMVMETPSYSVRDPESGEYRGFGGTEDLSWCDRVMEGGYLKKAGWPELQKKKYPFLMDTSLFCLHIDPNGTTYPLGARIVRGG